MIAFICPQMFFNPPVLNVRCDISHNYLACEGYTSVQAVVRYQSSNRQGKPMQGNLKYTDTIVIIGRFLEKHELVCCRKVRSGRGRY